MLAVEGMPGIPKKEQRERRSKAAAAGREAAKGLRGALAAAAVAACSAAEADSEYGAVLRPRWAEKGQRGAPRVIVRFQPMGDVTEDGWTQIFLDCGSGGPELLARRARGEGGDLQDRVQEAVLGALAGAEPAGRS